MVAYFPIKGGFYYGKEKWSVATAGDDNSIRRI